MPDEPTANVPSGTLGGEEDRRRALKEKLIGVRSRVLPGSVPAPGEPSVPPGLGAGGSSLLFPRAGEKEAGMNTGSVLYALPGVPQAPQVGEVSKGIITSSSRGPGQDLLHQAMLVEKERRKKKHRKKKRKDGSQQLASVLKSLTKKKKKKPPGGGDPSDSSHSSKKNRGSLKKVRRKKRLPDGTTVSFSDYSSATSQETTSSSESELEAPLKKRSRDRPGSVMEMLVAHVTTQLNQGALLDVAATSHSLLTGVKIVTHFALNIRPLYGGAQKEMREMYTLAQMLDAMRRGDLPTAGDIAAARFMAIHQSLLDGNWGSAKHMEITPLEDSQAASPALLLATRKHSKLFQKLQQNDGYGGGSSGFGRGRGRRQWSNWGGDAERQEPTGRGKGKSGKTKGKQKSGGKNATGNNPWANSLEKTEEPAKTPQK